MAVEEACGGCHGDSRNFGQMSNSELKKFALQTEDTVNCLKLNPTPASQAKNCFIKDNRVKPDIGLYRAAVKDPSVVNILRAGGISDATIHAVGQGIMPPEAPANPFNLTEESDTWQALVSWFVKDASMEFPQIEEFRPESGVQLKPCENIISDEFKAYLSQTASPTGVNWQNEYKRQGLPMFGCPETDDFPTDPRRCLKEFDSSPQWEGPDLGEQVLRTLRTSQMFSVYWMRSSVDGRFVSNGGASPEGFYNRSASATIDDLAITSPIPRKILMPGSYDPAYSPDNRFFMWVDKLCPMKVLTTEPLAKYIDFDNAQCLKASTIGTYQSIGSKLNGSPDFLVVHNSDYVADIGGADHRDPSYFKHNFLNITQFQKSSSNRWKISTTELPMIGESQFSMFPSGELTLSRSGQNAVQDSSQAERREAAYQIRFINKMLSDNNSYRQLEDESSSQICMTGTKAMVSLDERFIVTHHYITKQEDPERASNASDIKLFDLLTLKSYTLTNMPKDHFALFPHFRADGWIYFLVKDTAGKKEHIVASDAALVAADSQ